MFSGQADRDPAAPGPSFRIDPLREAAPLVEEARKSNVKVGHPRQWQDARPYLTSSTCSKSSSTGVARPKIITDTRTLFFS